MGNTANKLLLSGVIASTPVGTEVVFSHNYDNDALGTYTLASLREHWGTGNANVSFQNGTTKIIEDPNGTRGNVMSVAFKEGVNQYNKIGGCCCGTQ